MPVAERTRADHVAWCKQRALEYVEIGDLMEAVGSMISDMRKHPLTDTPLLIALAMVGMMEIDDAARVKRWINGFN